MVKKLIYACIGKGKAIMKIIYDALTCKFCGSRHIVKFGKFRGIQRFWCKACKRKFVEFALSYEKGLN